MTSPARVLHIAAAELGYSRWHDPEEGTKYGRWYATSTGAPYFGTSGVPYCAMFISWVLSSAGMTLFGNASHYAYCPWIERDAAARGRLRAFEDIQPGDVLLFDWDEDGVADHVGFAVARSGNYVHTIEGNTSPGAAGSQSNGGGVYRRVRHRSTVSAVIRPEYAAAPPTAPTRRQIKVDGIWGVETTTALQEALGTTVDGEIWGQHHPDLFTAAGTGWIFGGGNGSECIRSLQKFLGVTQDGIAGTETVTALQKFLGITQDGIAGAETVTALQKAINAGRIHR